MSTENKPAEADKKDETAAPAAKGGAVGGILKIIIPAILAAGAAYGGTRAAAAHAPGLVALAALRMDRRPALPA